MKRVACCLLVVVGLAACGDDDDTVPTEILPATTYEAQCEKPREGNEFPDEDGSLLREQLWLRSWIDDTYLWYQEVPRANPKMFKTAVDYFAILKTGVSTPSGKPKDQFHFTYETTEWEALSGSGIEAGYGVQWALLVSSPPRNIVAAYVQPGSRAALAGIKRGTQVLMVDGTDAISGNQIDVLNEGLFPSELEKSHTFVVRDVGATDTKTVTMASTSITSTPVQRIALPAPNEKIGYLLFNDHILTAQKQLMDAIAAFKTDGITDLVLDLRYNGGGYLAIAAELGYMIGGPTLLGKTFELLRFNDKYPTTDPVTGQPLSPQTFPDKAVLMPERGQVLPFLDLPIKRVFVLTGSGTCSASEAVMNSLAGADVQVIQIGSTTCGKPYGFYPTDNCGTTYFAIQFQGVNAKGFGEFADGFVPGGRNPGCVIGDDFSKELGDPAERRLQAALHYIANGACPPAVAAPASVHEPADMVPKPLWRKNAILTR